ncbi:hypothetical protein [Methylobacterium oryzisoli]|uniref:hypothetical protein n=1 Tax=Methylobacterium oryzisoli TaxID=3385502 RepID=UPI003891D090
MLYSAVADVLGVQCYLAYDISGTRSYHGWTEWEVETSLAERDKAIADTEVYRPHREIATPAGIKLSRSPSGHSTRVGATQDIFAAGFELLEVMQAGS